ncbi:MAG: UDP-N-acetylglucosamine 2-epimerase, partial [bacterium]
NLRREGIVSRSDATTASIDAPVVFQVGDVMKDAVDQNVTRAMARPSVAAKLGIAGAGYAVATLHRVENTDEPARLREIAAALVDLACDVPVVVPLHPRTRHALATAGIETRSAGVHWVEPLSYLDMLQLVSHAKLVLTDSGGLQKEAYLLGVPCVTLRDETEWVELVEVGWNRLAGADRKQILAAARDSLTSPPNAGTAGLYGDGHAADRIVAACLDWCRHGRA